MTIDFGSIRSYNNKGFGFVNRTFFNSKKQVFFHITKIQKINLELAQRLDNSESKTFETVNFWYEIETTERGEQVSKLWLSRENIPPSYTQELCGLIQKVESIWKNPNSPKPSWLELVTIELVGVDCKHELSVERNNLESQLRTAKEEQRRTVEALRVIAAEEAVRVREAEEGVAEALRVIAAEEALRVREAEKALRENEIGRIAYAYNLNEAEANELDQLLTEMRPLGFKSSRDLSKYIVRYQLGRKYKHISGILIMEQEGREWDFSGGFPVHIYKIICKELDLDNQGTSARPIRFTPFKDL